MLSFSSRQIDDLRTARASQLKNALFAQARDRWPERCEHLDDARLRDAIDKTVAKAVACGVSSDFGIGIFFRVALGWGLNFTENTQISWIHPVHRVAGEAADDWIARVHDIALATAKKERRWTWTKTTT